MQFKNSTKKYFLNLGLIVVLGIFLLPKTAYLSTITPEKIIDLVNAERIKHKEAPLTASQLLTQAAILKANDILKHQKFEHNFNDRKFSQWVRDTGYDYSYVGENLAVDFITAEGTLNAWRASPSHYKNIINQEFKETGVAVVEGKFKGQKTIVVVQIFGTKRQAGDTVRTSVSVQSMPELNKDMDRSKKKSLAFDVKPNLLSDNVPYLIYYFFKATSIYSHGLAGLALMV